MSVISKSNNATIGFLNKTCENSKEIEKVKSDSSQLIRKNMISSLIKNVTGDNHMENSADVQLIRSANEIQLLFNALLIKPLSLKNKLLGIISNFNCGTHSIIYKDFIIHLVKPDDNSQTLSFGIANIEKKCFAKGGSGKMYDVDLINSKIPLVLKLSRKKLKSKDKYGRLIPLTPEEKINVAKKGSSRGAVASRDIFNEYKMMQFIKMHAEEKKGLNCEVFSYVTYKNQSGLFIKKYDFDGSELWTNKPSTALLYNATVQIIRGFITLNELNIVHRDIKLENTLFNLTTNNDEIMCEGVISDFGGACFLDDLFKDNPYPSVHEVRGGGTTRNISFQIMNDLAYFLNKLKKYQKNSKEYTEITNEIKDLMRAGDRCALGILLYRLWTNSDFPLNSYSRGEYLKFDDDLSISARNEILEEIEMKIHKACLGLSAEDRYETVDLIKSFLDEGLYVEELIPTDS